MSTDLGQRKEEQPSTRHELAQQLLARVDRLANRLGDVSLAIEIQHLKRELVRGHTVLANRPADNNFLSVVTLVEATLASLTWKGYTPVILDALRRSLLPGLDAGEFPFEEYDAIRRHEDPLSCVLGQLNIPRQGYDDDLLLDFHQRFTAVPGSVPNCKLCNFRRDQRVRLRRRKIDLLSLEVRQWFASSPGFIRQSEQFEEASKTKDQSPSCSWCERLGDTIIALLAKPRVTVVTADRTFVPLGELLGQKVILLPSLAELKRLAQDGGEKAGS